MGLRIGGSALAMAAKDLHWRGKEKGVKMREFQRLQKDLYWKANKDLYEEFVVFEFANGVVRGRHGDGRLVEDEINWEKK
ncbi:unnamed protein product [Linum trigynum]|uniref:Uncharacterized protein n=1 Tax=Linum trigynum TaxID=586398 RepID=A0AAV2DBE3_9ROSI